MSDYSTYSLTPYLAHCLIPFKMNVVSFLAFARKFSITTTNMLLTKKKRNEKKKLNDFILCVVTNEKRIRTCG